MNAHINVAQAALREFVARGGLDENQLLIVQHGLDPDHSVLIAPPARMEPHRLPQVSLGMLLIHGGLDETQMAIVRAGLEGCEPGNRYTRDEAYAFQGRAQEQGISCYVRCWHRGSAGYFVIRWEDFTRVLDEDVLKAEQRLVA